MYSNLLATYGGQSVTDKVKSWVKDDKIILPPPSKFTKRFGNQDQNNTKSLVLILDSVKVEIFETDSTFRIVLDSNLTPVDDIILDTILRIRGCRPLRNLRVHDVEATYGGEFGRMNVSHVIRSLIHKKKIYLPSSNQFYKLFGTSSGSNHLLIKYKDHVVRLNDEDMTRSCVLNMRLCPIEDEDLVARLISRQYGYYKKIDQIQVYTLNSISFRNLPNNNHGYPSLDNSRCSLYKQVKSRDFKSNVWMLWLGQMPKIVVELLEITKNKLSSNYHITIITKQNIRDYVDFDHPVYKKAMLLNLQFCSDILRLSLLQTYGGYWIDATCLITKDVLPDFDDFLLPRHEYHRVRQLRYDNWFMASKPRDSELGTGIYVSKLLTMCLDYLSKYDDHKIYHIQAFLIDKLLQCDETAYHGVTFLDYENRHFLYDNYGMYDTTPEEVYESCAVVKLAHQFWHRTSRFCNNMMSYARKVR